MSGMARGAILLGDLRVKCPVWFCWNQREHRHGRTPAVFHIYVDETSKNATYFGVGAIFCSRDSAQQIASFMTETVVKHGHDPEKEIH